MKLLSNFDTNLDEVCYQENVDNYWKEKVFLVYKDKIFFIFYVLIPLSVSLLILIPTLISVIVLDLGIFWWLTVLVEIIFFSFTMWKSALKRYLDYRMDFTVINPDLIMAYNQTWFFSRDSRTIKTNKIKTISIDKKWIIKSIFNYWTLVFLSEWDEKWKWDITLMYVQNPDEVRKRIKQVIDFAESWN